MTTVGRDTAGVRLEVGIDCREPERLATFWAAALGYRVGDLDEAMTYLDLIPPDPSLPGVYLQRVPEEKIVKNRVHLDLYSASPEATVEYLVTLGATVLGAPHTDSGGAWWQVMADPDGNEFCVCREHLDR